MTTVLMMKIGMTVVLMLSTMSVLEAFSLSKCSRQDGRQYILNTTSGRLVGACDFVHVDDNTEKDMSGNVYSWLAVPYAEPPVGTHRFKAPIPIRYRQYETIDATKWPSSCVQLNLNDDNEFEGTSEDFPGFAMWRTARKHATYSEDCLYLNIWAPAQAYHKMIPRPGQSHQKTPIMVFFHGGSTVRGTTAIDVLNPAVFVAATNTIVITVNYRLGIYGSFYLDHYFPGNQAVLDQHEALKWIHANADKFGGDKDRITIVGTNSGAAFVGYHLFYQDSFSLFRNAILQSGSPLLSYLQPIQKSEANSRAREVLRLAGCATPKSSQLDMSNCAINSQNLTHAAVNYFRKLNSYNEISQQFTMTAFPPVIDGRVLTDTPAELLKAGKFKKCPILTGFNTDEGTYFIGKSGIVGRKASDLRKLKPINHKLLEKFLRDYFLLYPSLSSGLSHMPANSFKTHMLVSSILHEYTKIVDSQREGKLVTSPLLKPNYFNTLAKIIGDQMITCPGYEFANYAAKFETPVYLYLFAHRISSTPWPRIYGATHGDELVFTFAHPLADLSRQSNQQTVSAAVTWNNPTHRYLRSEKALGNEIVYYWSNFAKYDSPNGPVNYHSYKNWPQYTLFEENFESTNLTNLNESTRYLILKTNGTRISRGYSLDSCQFWSTYLPKIVQDIDHFERRLEARGLKASENTATNIQSSLISLGLIVSLSTLF